MLELMLMMQLIIYATKSDMINLNIDSIHGIARGGLIPAVLISHKLGLPWTVCAVGT